MKNFKLIVSSDPGGAYCLAFWAKKKKINFISCLGVHAKKIFKEVFNNKISTVSLNKGINLSNEIITSTSWKSDLEKKAMLLAKKNKKKITVLFDHWVNYEDRVKINKKLIIPDKILVQDSFAEKKCKKIFKKLKILKIPNYFLNKNVLEIKRKKIKKNNNILYLTEPIKEHYYKKKDYDEFSAIHFFLKNINKIKNRINNIYIRIHPSEKKNKYLPITRKFKDLPIVFSKNRSLVSDISRCSTVCGCETFAMVIAVKAKKRTICTIPKKSKEICSLPFKKIEYLRELIK